MNTPKIISVGEVLWDLFPDGELFGGAPANFACQAALQSARVAMISAVGDDKRGHDAIKILRNYGIDVSLMQTCADAPTGTVGVELDSQGKPTYIIHADSAWDRLQWRDELLSHVKSADAVCFGTLGQRSAIARQTIRRMIEAAAAAGITRIVDINLRPPFFDAETIRDSIQLASILKLSDEELDEVCSAVGIVGTNNVEDSLENLRKVGELEMIVMTRGAQGALLVTADETIHQAGLPAEVVDTVGAGDAFTAAFLFRELQHKPRRESLQHACKVAAETCSHAGAVPSSISPHP